ncbi:AfsR/SARP family transcriptional regulator [Paractinoplanes brasiliensis]|uniref:DNA-binding SARP family transcriptional activator n=1 Tax=Paractinoplanes brasiliensis TaxID=52695 RepID=A0A4R6JF06_9ACTN|nr:AfsR/SARP family transcriptional regulator [Actinoplanes brasiliensis]TDO33196.1 DNA-binding SARP family transcriptional activator [Actinoplanes brasiliensis]GID33227.1 SARP family transcriptional regulator [Actinoplanes brasiliensis]
MEFRILGPLEVSADGERVDVSPREQIVLASLLLEAGRIVPVTRLTHAIYGDEAPPTGRVQAQICISALRRLLAAHGRTAAIVTRSQGYVLQIDAESLDLHEHDKLVARARGHREARRPAEAVRHYRAALALWRGDALEGVPSPQVLSAVSHLDERRMTVREECIELELQLGRHRDLIPELTALVAAYPLHDRLRGQLMLALYRSDRQAEALEVFRSGRRTMIDDLGLEPNEWLRELQHSILTADAALRMPPPVTTDWSGAERVPAGPPDASAPPAGASPPKMLPTDIGDFTGRAEQVRLIEQRFADDPDRVAVPVVVVVGKPGVGKTTLAVHVAHRLAGAYTDGQLFADLRGRVAGRVEPAGVLERFLHALGVSFAAMPQGLDERAELYRGFLSQRRTLIVLDNVEDEGQVLPLLPGLAGSAVLVTSQARLSGIPGATHVALEVFDPDQSLELLARIDGQDRVDAEPAAAVALTELCGRLPLALRIAGARLAARPQWGIGYLVDRLQDEVRRLDELRHGGMEIRASLSLCYEAVDPAARRLFRLLSALDFPTFSGWMAAALLDMPPHEAQDLLDVLADAQLVETTGTALGVHGRYRFHDLIGVFARERLAQEESPAERDAAISRVLGALSFLSAEAHRRVYGDAHLQAGSTPGRWPLPRRLVEQLLDPPLVWFEWEHASIVAGVRQAAQVGLVDLCWDMALSAVTLFESRAYLDDWRETHDIALDAARVAGNRPALAAMLYSVGVLSMVEQRFPDAREELVESAAMFRSISDERGEGLAVRTLAFVDRITGNLADAERRYEQARESALRLGDPAALAHVLYGQVQVQVDGGHMEKAMATLGEALELSRRAGSRRLESQVLHQIGLIHLEEGRAAAAIACFDRVLDAVRDLGDPIGEAYALHGLGMATLGTATPGPQAIERDPPAGRPVGRSA